MNVVLNDLAACELKRRSDMRRGLDVVTLRTGPPRERTGHATDLAVHVIGTDSGMGTGRDPLNGLGGGASRGSGRGTGLGSGDGRGQGSGYGSTSGCGRSFCASDVFYRQTAGTNFTVDVFSFGSEDSCGDGTGSGVGIGSGAYADYDAE